MRSRGILSFECRAIPLAEWTISGLGWFVDRYRPVFQSIQAPFDLLLQWFGWALNSVPPAALAARQFGGRKLAGALVFIGFIGVWQDAVTTLSIVLTSVVVAMALGIWAARSERVFMSMRPIVDGMQTIPALVYLAPVVMLLGIGTVPGVMVTVVPAVPPLIRLTNLGIRQVLEEVLEAMNAFGANRPPALVEGSVTAPLPTTITGFNQTLMDVALDGGCRLDDRGWKAGANGTARFWPSRCRPRHGRRRWHSRARDGARPVYSLTTVDTEASTRRDMAKRPARPRALARRQKLITEL